MKQKRLESFVREAFVQRQHAVGVFFDLEKAYESTWKFGIMRDLHNAGAAGGANAPAYWAPASLIRPTPKKTPVA